MPRDPLSHMPHRPRRPCVVAGEFALATGRVHEFCGPARQALALAVAGRLSGPVIWITPDWQGEALCGPGVNRWIDPARLLIVRAGREAEGLWCMEEALRAGAAPLVVAEMEAPPGMVPVRRLHLAAGSPEGTAPLGLILTPGTGGAPGIESRWQAAPAHAAGLTRWELRRLRARMAPPAAWHLTQPAPRAELVLSPLAALEATA
ncbi:ImuA family protein [Vannielia sp. SX4]|uniref:ImuA family protein n=1 Tax=Vannielia sp. SX4 TaxID=3463852 RepID=UPI0040590E27